jgi:spore maturation protein SpmB
MIHHRIRLIFIPLLTAFLGWLFLAYPAAAAEGFAYGLSLCVSSLLPALFPFFVLTNLLLNAPGSVLLGKVLRPVTKFCSIPEQIAPLVLLLSWLGGYTVCAQCLACYRSRHQLCARSATLLSILGCCSSPGFVIAYAGRVLLGSVRIGVLLYGLQIAANFLSAACIIPFLHCFSVLPEENLKDSENFTFTCSLPQAIQQAATSCIGISSCVLFFSTLSAAFCTLLPAPLWIQAGQRGVLEISSGCAAFGNLSGGAALYGIAFCLSALGLSVFFQIQLLSQNHFSLWPLVISRGLHLFWMQVLLRLFLHFFPSVASVYSSLAPRLIVMPRFAPDCAILVFSAACLTLYKVRKSLYNK